MLRRAGMRRAARAAVAAGVLVVLPAPAAHADATSTWSSPAEGADVTTATPLRLEVVRDLLDAPPTTVEARLTRNGLEPVPGSSVVELACAAGCDDVAQTWSAGNLQPATARPFGTGEACNGRHVLQARVDGGPWGAGRGVVLRTAPRPVTGLEATPRDGDVVVAWTPSPTPDVTGTRVETRRPGGAWIELATLVPGPTSLTHADPGAGTHEYRVTVLRGDGRVDGAPVAACEDPGRDLASPTATTSATLSAPAPSPSPSSPSGSTGGTGGAGGSGSGGGAGSAGGTGGEGSGTGGGTGADAGGAGGDSSTGGSAGSSGDGGTTAGDGGGSTATTAPTRSGPRVAAPPTATRRSVEASVPSVAQPQVAAPGSSEDEGFSTSLYDGVALPSQEPDPRTVTVERRTPGAVVATTVQTFVPEDAAPPVAAGLLMTTLGLHLLRVRRRRAF